MRYGYRGPQHHNSTELLKCVIPIVSKPLATLLTASLRHGYIPKCFRDSVVLPIPKSGKNVSVSDNYRPKSLASNFSKLIEYIILEKYSNYFTRVDHQRSDTMYSRTLFPSIRTNVVRLLHTENVALLVIRQYTKSEERARLYHWFMPSKRSLSDVT